MAIDERNYAIERFRELGSRLEECLRKLEERSGQIIAMREQLTTAQQTIADQRRSISELWAFGRQLQTQIQANTGRLDGLDECVSQLEEEVKRATATKEAILIEDKKGEWSLRIATHTEKLKFIIALVLGILASGAVGQFVRWLIENAKPGQ